MKLILLIWFAIMAVYHCYDPECDDCTDDFEGFGMPASKCGCCPWPCCCKCFNVSVQNGECAAPIDLLFVLDSSHSVTVTGWEQTKSFVCDVIGLLSTMEIGASQRVAMITYSDDAFLEWNLGQPQTLHTLCDSITGSVSNLPHLNGDTNTGAALDLAKTDVFGSPANNLAVPDIAIVITDGKPFPPHDITVPAHQLRTTAAGVMVIAVGVTGFVNTPILQNIAGPGGHVFHVDDFLDLQTILQPLLEAICEEEKCYCCCTPEQFFGGGGAYYYMK